MKVLLRRNIQKLGQFGDVVEVRDGYARNYLIPQGLALAPTKGNLKAIEAERQAYLAELAEERAALEQRAKLLDGKEFTITARANEEGHLYGSVGPAQIAVAVTKDGFLVDAGNIVLDEPIRRLDKYDVPVQFAEDVRATIAIWVVPPHDVESADAEFVPPEGQEAAETEPGTEPPADEADEAAQETSEP
jgi:large subunit ribosomal protein L9